MDIIASAEAGFDAVLADVEAAVTNVEGYVNSGFSALQAENTALKAKLADYEARILAMVTKLKAIVPAPVVEPTPVPEPAPAPVTIDPATGLPHA